MNILKTIITALALNIVNAAHPQTRIVAGPNLDQTSKKYKRWSARGEDQTGRNNVPNDLILLADVDVVLGDADESGVGCTYRVSGRPVKLDDFPTGNLDTLQFQPFSGVFCSTSRFVEVKPRFLALLPDGSIMGVE